VGGSLVLRKAKNPPRVYLEQGERSERDALGPPPILGRASHVLSSGPKALLVRLDMLVRSTVTDVAKRWEVPDVVLYRYWTSYEFVRTGTGFTLPTATPYGMAMGWTDSLRLDTDTVLKSIVTADVGIRSGGDSSHPTPADWVAVTNMHVSLGWSTDVDGRYPAPTSPTGTNSLLGTDHMTGQQMMSGPTGDGPAGYFTNSKPAVFEGQRKGNGGPGTIPIVSCAILMHSKDGIGSALSSAYIDWQFRVWVRVLWGSTDPGP